MAVNNDGIFLIDSHIHTNHLVLPNCDQVIQEINDNPSLYAVINVGMNIETSMEAVNIAINNPKFYAAVGIHPLYIKGEFDENLYSLVNDKVVAIGEIGLDFNSEVSFYEQRRYLILQIIAANVLHLPVIIHSNNANKEVLEIFEKYVKPRYGCVFHCFQPQIEYLDEIIKNDYYISFAGRITYKNACKSIEVAKRVPDDLFLIETDLPFVSPEPFRDQINTPGNIQYIVKKLAEVKGTTEEYIRTRTMKNTMNLFTKIK